jgi:hypothetical protein
MPAIKVAAMPQLVAQHFIFGIVVVVVVVVVVVRFVYNYDDIFIIIF